MCTVCSVSPFWLYIYSCASDLTFYFLLPLLSLSPSHHVQSATIGFKEQCGLPVVAKLKQCIQTLATRLQSPEGTMGATMVLKDGYPCLEPLVNLSEPTRKLLTAYDAVSKRRRRRERVVDTVLKGISHLLTL